MSGYRRIQLWIGTRNILGFNFWWKRQRLFNFIRFRTGKYHGALTTGAHSSGCISLLQLCPFRWMLLLKGTQFSVTNPDWNQNPVYHNGISGRRKCCTWAVVINHVYWLPDVYPYAGVRSTTSVKQESSSNDLLRVVKVVKKYYFNNADLALKV